MKEKIEEGKKSSAKINYWGLPVFECKCQKNLALTLPSPEFSFLYCKYNLQGIVCILVSNLTFFCKFITGYY